MPRRRSCIDICCNIGRPHPRPLSRKRAGRFVPSAAKDSAAAVGLARCLTARGKDDEARKALLAAPGENADVAAELAAMAFERGAVEEARKRAEEAVKLDRDQLQARWLLAELARIVGPARRGRPRLSLARSAIITTTT